ncbi:hypothetical protein QUF76_16935 [Desulfobacterales bacterium HSG16]|nr:hypothetical protein [Desulfobacterales bacterium HSG16]
MAFRNWKFFDSAVFLEKILNTLLAGKKQITRSSPLEKVKTDFKARKGRSQPAALADILERNHVLTRGKVKSEKLCIIQCRRMKNRVETLENEIKLLNRRLGQLHKFIAGMLAGSTGFRRYR